MRKRPAPKMHWVGNSPLLGFGIPLLLPPYFQKKLCISYASYEPLRSRVRLAQTVGEEAEPLAETLGDLGIYLNKKDYKYDTKTLLKRVCREFFGPPVAFVDMVLTTTLSFIYWMRHKRVYFERFHRSRLVNLIVHVRVRIKRILNAYAYANAYGIII